MAQEVITWCDTHMQDEDQRVPGREVRVAIGGEEPMTLDLCDECHKALLGRLEEALTALGRPVRVQVPKSRNKKRSETSAPSTEGVWPCPVEGCEYPRPLSRSGLRDHVTDEHGTELSIVEGKRGYTVDGLKINYFCDLCEAGFSTPQGRGAHKSTKHGVEGSSKASTYERAKRRQDGEEATLV